MIWGHVSVGALPAVLIMKRTVKVNRLNLIAHLADNLKKHCEEYDESLQGYKQTLIEKIEEAEKSVKDDLHKQIIKLTEDLVDIKLDDISNQPDYFDVLTKSHSVLLEVPKSYVEQYEKAMTMFHWDVQDEVELTSDEVDRYINDNWEWKQAFLRTSAVYKK